MNKLAIFISSLGTILLSGVFVVVSFNKKLDAVSESNVRIQGSFAELDSRTTANQSKIEDIQQVLAALQRDKTNLNHSNFHTGLSTGGKNESLPKQNPKQLLTNQFSKSTKQGALNQLKSTALKPLNMPKELMEIKAAMTEGELVELEEEVDRRLFQMNAKIANDLGMSASELDEFKSIADPRAIELMRSSCEQSVLHDKLLKLNEEIFKEINPKP